MNDPARPQAAPVAALHHAPRLLRAVASLVLVCFTMLVLAPAAAAARTAAESANQNAGRSAGTRSEESEYAAAVTEIAELLAKIDAGLAQGADMANEHRRLADLQDTLIQLETPIQEHFAAIEALIQSKNLPAAIRDRHQAAVAVYNKESKALHGHLKVIEETDPAKHKEKVRQARDWLKGMKHQRTHQDYDPNQLPNRNLTPNPGNQPRTTPEAFRSAGLFDTPYLQVAALGDFTYAKLPGAEDPAYLATSDEVTKSPAIQAKAEELGHDPVKIHHWVRNNVEWLPTWGAIQNADLTLSAKRGNAFDIASLTLALLRASGIPARYVHGTVDIPADQFRNWTGGFDTVEAAADFAASGGIPVTTLTSGGAITKIRLEHIWVEAAIDYVPSRGAQNRDADTWVALDPSYKQYEYLPGLDVAAIGGIDPQQLAQSFLNSGTVNETEGWATGFDPAPLQAAQTQAQQALQTHITQNLPNATVGDVIGGRKTILRESPILPSGLPYPKAIRGAHYDKIPKALQQQVQYAFGKDVLGDLIDPLTLPWSRVNNQKLTLSFKPATEADEQALLALLPQGQITDVSQLPSSIPSYLISVIPELKLEGNLIKQGPAMKLGEELDFHTTIRYPGLPTLPHHGYKVIAGSYLVVNAVAGSVSTEKLNSLKTRLEQTKTKLESQDQAQLASLTREELLGDLFYAGGLGYWAQYTALAYLGGLASKGRHILAGGYGTLGYEPNVDYFFGFPRAIEPGGVVLDIPIVNITASLSGDPQKKKQYIQQNGILSSALEHAVPEQMFTNPADTVNKPDAISAVKALQKANAAGQRIYHITPANQAQTMPKIGHNEAVMLEIQSALNAGKEVITHAAAVSVPGWSGAGYIILDPLTGDGAYKIGGGMSGGRIGLGVGLALGLAASSIVQSGGKTAPAIGTIIANPAIALMLSFIGGFMLGLAGKDAFEGKGQSVACFLKGLITGIEVGIVMGDILTKGEEKKELAVWLLEAIIVATDMTVDEYADLPSRRECGVFP